MYKVDEETDVVYSVACAVGPVSSRDFVSLRQISKRNGFFVSASVATTFSDKPPQPGKVRYEGREKIVFFCVFFVTAPIHYSFGLALYLGGGSGCCFSSLSIMPSIARML